MMLNVKFNCEEYIFRDIFVLILFIFLFHLNPSSE